MPKMTKAQHAAMNAKRKEYDDAMKAVFENGRSGADGSLRGNLMTCAPHFRKRFEAARHALDDYERQMISAGRAWRSETGGFYPNE